MEAGIFSRARRVTGGLERGRITVGSMERSDVVDKIRTYRAELTAEQNRIDAELRRLDAALAAFAIGHENLNATTTSQTGSDSDTAGTFDLLREYIRSNSFIHATAALEYLIGHGWRTDARHPLNATRTALAHLATWGEIERVRRGVYRPVTGAFVPAQTASAQSLNSGPAALSSCCGTHQVLA